MISIAVAGLGSHAQKNILPTIVSTPGLKLAGVWTRNQNVATQQSSLYRCKNFQSYEDLLKDSSISVIFIATPNATHFDLANQALDAGKHVWVEKSLTHQRELTEKLIAKARSKNLSLCEAFMYLHHPQFKKVQELLNFHTVGEPLFLSVRFGFPHREPGDIRYQRKLGGGALMDCGCYCVSLICELMGSDWKVLSRETLSEPGYEVDTRGSLIFKKGDCIATLSFGMGLSYLNELEIWGSKGRLIADRIFSKPSDFKPTITVLGTNAGDKTLIEIPAFNHFAAMLEEFLKTLQDTGLRAQYWDRAQAQAKLTF